MDTMLIQVTNNKARKLLKDLEELDLIKVIKETVSEKKSLSQKYVGSISKEEGEKLNKHIEESRKGWDSI